MTDDAEGAPPGNFLILLFAHAAENSFDLWG
jgi:hypothetical protein